MLKRNRGGINNLLINRLRRHANLATLFRSIDTPPPARYQPTRTVAIPAYVVPGPTASLEQPPLTSIAKQEDGVKTADAMEQATWRRLQAIYRAHEQKSDSAPEGAEPGPVKQVQSPGPGHLQRKAVQTAPQAQPPLPKIAGERTDMGLESAAKEQLVQQATDASGLAEQVTDYADILPAGEAAPSQPVPLQPQPLQAAWPIQPLRTEPGPKPGAGYHGEPVAEPGRRPEATPEPPVLDHSRMQAVAEQIPSGMPSSSSVEQIPPRRPRPQPISTPEASPPTGEEFETGRSDTYEAPTPEPAAEPGDVQRAETSVDRAEADGGWRTAERQPFTEAAHAGTAAPMQDPGPEPLQATPPRERPADSPVPEAPGEMSAPTHASPGDVSTVQKSRPSQTFQAPPDAPLASIQRQLNPQAGDEGASIGARPADPAFIPTELGPLPADLWDLLGQPRPAPEMHKPLSGVPTQLAESGVPDQRQGGKNTPGTGRWVETLPASQAPVQRAFYAETAAPSWLAPEPGRKTGPAGVLTRNAETPLPSPSGAAPAPAFEQIQREPIEIGEVPSPVQTEPPGPGTDTGQGGEVNLDELARRVYAEVRARLAVEWERLRR